MTRIHGHFDSPTFPSSFRYAIILFAVLVITIMPTIEIFAQGYPGDAAVRRNNQSGNSAIINDSLTKPPLTMTFYHINEFGYLEFTRDSIPRLSLSSDLQYDDIHNSRLGNIFSATLPTISSFGYQIGNKLGIKSYQFYADKFTSGIISSPNRPLVYAEYATRFGDGHRNIRIDFNRRFARNITFGFQIYSGQSNGQYAHQQSSYNRLEFNVLQQGKSKRRSSYIHFSIHRNSEEMNGGLANPNDVFTPLAGGNSGYQTNLGDTQFGLKNTNIKIGSMMKLGIDSISSDVTKSVFVELGSNKERYRYEDTNLTDEDKTFYSPLILSGTTILTQTSNRNYYEKIGLQLKSSKTTSSVALQGLQNSIAQDSITNINQNQIFLKAKTKLNISSKSILRASFYQELGGNTENNFSVAWANKIQKHQFNLSASLGSENPGIIQTTLAIHGETQWNNNFENEKYVTTTLAYQNETLKTHINLRYQQVKNLVYLSRIGLYQQLAESMEIYSLELQQKFSILNFYFDNIIYLQSISNEEVLSLPKISSRHDIGTSISFFKKKLETKIGAILWLQDSSSLPSFSPVINDFYFPDNNLISRYFRAAPYIRATIDTFEIFLAVDDLYNQINNRRHFGVSGYPELDSRINLGFRWKLLD